MSVVDQYAAAMRRLLVALVLASGCAGGPDIGDFSFSSASACGQSPGAPIIPGSAACYSDPTKVGACDCATRPVNGVDPCRHDCVVFGAYADLAGGEVADLSFFDLGGVACACAPWDVCLSPAQVCIGRGVECEGDGARCLPKGGSCDNDAGAGDPPDVVGIDNGDAGPSTGHFCPYKDDVCCPGTFGPPPDLSVIDANVDQSVSTD